MSGPSDLARLTVTIDTANELLLSEEVKMMDVGGGVMRPTNAMVMANLSTLLGGAMPYTSVAKGIIGTADGTNFSVLSSAQDEYVNIYRNTGGEPVFVDTYPSALALTKMKQLVRPYDDSAQDRMIFYITNLEGEVAVEQTWSMYRTPTFSISSENGRTVIGDDEGGIVVEATRSGYTFGLIEHLYSDSPGHVYANEEGEVLLDLSGQAGEMAQEDPLSSGVVFSTTLVTAQGYEQTIYVQGLLAKRQLASKVVGSIASTQTSKSATGAALRVPASTFGAGAVLNLRGAETPASRRLMTLSVKNVPVQSPVVPVKILLLGDSILNRQGGFLLQQLLVPLGFAPTFIGTMKGSTSATDNGNALGPLGEAREGWETGDYSNAITDRALILPPGEEATYLAMSKPDQRDRNVFARAATGSDPAGIVRNGYVFDPAFYQERFGLETPDIVINNLGANNVRDRRADEIYDGLLADDTLIHSQIRAAWPNAKIIRFIPGTAINAERNALWTSHYVPAIRAIQQSAANLGDTKLTIAPIWALTNPEVGYAFSSAPAKDGLTSADWSDAIHPIQASRLALFEALAPYVGAAAIGII